MPKTEEEKGTTRDLRTHLYKQIENLNDPKADLDKEIKKAQALASAGTVIINSIKAETDFRRQLTMEQKLEDEKNNKDNKAKLLENGKSNGK